jgi:hypothetical protein
VYAAEINMDYQARIPAALAAIHNFIRMHDPTDLDGFMDSENLDQGFVAGDLAAGPTRAAEKRSTNTRRDDIASSMWAQYQAELQARGEA